MSGFVTISTSGVPARLKSTGAVDASLGAADVNRLRGVLLQMRALDPDEHVAFRLRHGEAALYAERLVVLGDLVALRVVGVEVVLAMEDRALGDPAAERVAQQDRPLHRRAVRHRQRAWQSEADRACLRVRRLEVRDRTATEHLRPRLQVDVDLQPDHRLPVHLRRSGT
jgi:hypothetical protein